MKRCYFAFVLSALSPIFAQEFNKGWTVGFLQDTFDNKLYPVATIEQLNEPIPTIKMNVYCDKNGDLVIGFDKLISFASTLEVGFKLGDSVKNITFKAAKVPFAKNPLIAKVDDSKILLDGFIAANGTSISFRDSNDQGSFSTVGSKEAFEVVKNYCNQ